MRKRSGKVSAPTKATRQPAERPPDCPKIATDASAVMEPTGLEFARSVTPVRRKGNVIEVEAKKTREQFCDELFKEIAKVTGVGLEVAVRLASQMANAMVWPKPEGQVEFLIKAISAFAEHTPRNAVEASLAVQMTATAEAALMFLYRATLPDQRTEFVDLNLTRAARLMRLHLEQIELMQKLKGKAGQQKVTVEHVHVHPGGQAVVGAVEAPKPREGGG